MRAYKSEAPLACAFGAILSGLTSSGVDRSIQGDLTSNPNTAYVLNFYSNAEVNASGFGEGETWLGSLDVHTNAQSTVNFSFPLGASELGRFVTATATDANGNTSEFSLASAIVPPLSRFLNISTRLRVQTGDNVLIGGFIIDGTESKESNCAGDRAIARRFRRERSAG